MLLFPILFLLIYIGGSWLTKGKIFHSLFQAFPENYLLAVFDTTSDSNDTILTYYNKDFAPIYKQKLKMGTIDGLTGLPHSFENKIYLAPTGVWKKKDMESIVELDTTSEKSIIYDLKKTGIWNLAVSSQFIFFTADHTEMTGVNLIRLDKKTKKQESLDFYKEEISRIDVYGQKLYVFANGENESNCYVYDINTFTLENTVDFTPYGRNPVDTCFIDQKLYFPLDTDQYDKPVHILVSWNLITNEIEKIDLPLSHPRQIVTYKDYLLISHDKEENSDYGSLSIYNLKNGEISKQKLKNDARQMEVKEDRLYVLEAAFPRMGVYQLNSEKEEVKQIGEYELKSMDGQFKTYYMPGFFVAPDP